MESHITDEGKIHFRSSQKQNELESFSAFHITAFFLAIIWDFFFWCK